LIVVDASVLIAHLHPVDEHHAAATDFLIAATDQVLLIHPLNLAEVLVGGARSGRVLELANDLTAIGIRAAPHDDSEPLRLAELRASTGLRLPDCCALDTAMTQHAPLATFDAALARAAQQHRIDVLP